MQWLIPLAVCVSFRLYMCGRPHWSCLSAHGLEKSWNFSLQMKGGIEYSVGPGRTLLLWPLIGSDSLSKDWNELLLTWARVLLFEQPPPCFASQAERIVLSCFFFPPTFFSILTPGFQTDLSDLFYKSYGSRGGFAPSHLSPLDPLGPSISLLYFPPRLGCQSHTQSVEEVPMHGHLPDTQINKQSVLERFLKSCCNKS